jgi:hypothetical protein
MAVCKGLQEGGINDQREQFVEGVGECYLTCGELWGRLSVGHMQGPQLEGAL